MAKAKKAPKEKKERTPVSKGTMLVSSTMILLTAAIVAVAFVFVNPDATKMVQAIELKGFGGGNGHVEEHYGPPIEFLAEIQSEEANSKQRYMQGGITISIENKKKAEKLKEKSAKFNDLYIRYLGTQTMEDLKTFEGQKKAKEELKELIYEEIGVEVVGVYFTKWIFQ